MATYTFFTGWEHGSLSGSPGTGLFATTAQLPDTGGTVPTIETTTVHHGTKALRCSGAPSDSSWILTLPASTQRVVGICYVYLVSLPSADGRLLSLVTAAGDQHIGVTTAGVSYAETGGGNRQTGPTLSTGQWYRLDYDSNTSAVNHTLDWRVNSTTQTQSATVSSPGAQDQTAHRWGRNQSITFDAIYDCAALSFTGADYPLPDVYVLGYAPNEDTDITQVGSGAFVDASATAISAGNPAWDNLDSRDFEQSAERVEQTAIDAAGFIEVGFENSAESGAPLAVMAEGAFRADTATLCDIEARLRSGTNEDSWANGDPSETTNVKGWKCYNTEPVSGAAWTDALFDALRMRFGYSGDATPDPWICALLLEALFTSAAAAERVPYLTTMPQLLAH